MDTYAEVFGALIGRARDEAIDALTDNRNASQLHVASGAEAPAEAMNTTYDAGEPDTGGFRFGSSGGGFGSTFA